MAKRENTPTYRSRGDRLAGTKTKSALNLEVLSRSFAPVRDFLVFDDLPLIETAEAGSFDRRDVDKHISAAATLRLNEPIALGRIEPLHGAFKFLPLRSSTRTVQQYSVMSCGGEYIDNLLDGFVGAVVCGFELAIWTVVRIRSPT